MRRDVAHTDILRQSKRAAFIFLRKSPLLTRLPLPKRCEIVVVRNSVVVWSVLYTTIAEFPALIVIFRLHSQDKAVRKSSDKETDEVTGETVGFGCRSGCGARSHSVRGESAFR